MAMLRTQRQLPLLASLYRFAVEKEIQLTVDRLDRLLRARELGQQTLYVVVHSINVGYHVRKLRLMLWLDLARHDFEPR